MWERVSYRNANTPEKEVKGWEGEGAGVYRFCRYKRGVRVQIKGHSSANPAPPGPTGPPLKHK